MNDEAEVERIAVLLHEAFNEYHRVNETAVAKRGLVSFAELDQFRRNGYRFIARAVLADQFTPPVVVTTDREG